MNTLTRRDFLKYCGLGTAGTAAAFALAGCAKDDTATTGGTTTNEGSTSIADTKLEGDGQFVIQQDEVDTTRRTTTTDPGERYPVLSLAQTSDPMDMDIRNWWKKGTISAAMFEQIGDYHTGYDWFTQWIIGKGYTEVETFWGKVTMEVDADGTESPWVEKIEKVAEGTEGAKQITVWDIEIYDYVHDWDGNNITAEDVVYCYKEEKKSGYALKYNTFVWCEAVGDYTIRFYWDTNELASVGPVEFPLCKTALYSKKGAEAGDYVTNPVATAPYKFVKYQSGVEIVLEANDDYWQTDESLRGFRRHANVQTIKFPIITEKSQIVMNLQTRNVSYSSSVSAEDISLFEEGGEYNEYFNVMKATASNVYFLIFNCYETSPCSDINFRIALSYAIDTEACAVGCGASYFALKGPGSNGTSDYDTALDNEENWQTVYDPEKAKEYLAKSNYATKYESRTLVIEGGGQGDGSKEAEVVNVLLEEIGVKSEIKIVDSTIANADQANALVWDIWLGSSSGENFVGGFNRTVGKTDFKTEDYIGYRDAIGFQNDDKLYELFKKANSSAHFGKEATAEMLRYCVENAYFKWTRGGYTNHVFTKDIADFTKAMQSPKDIFPWVAEFYLDDLVGLPE